jgi:uncharacterized protein (DUF2267 family)
MKTCAPLHKPLAPDPAEDLIVNETDVAMYIRLPRLTSSHHQLSVIWQLHQIASATLDPAKEIVLDLAALDELPLPLVTVLSAFEQDQRRSGHTLRVIRTMGVRSDSIRNTEDKAFSKPCDRVEPLAGSTQLPSHGHGLKDNGDHLTCGENGREETTMDGNKSKDDFEQRLLDHVEMVYAVALKLTRDPQDAERIARSTLLQAWHSRDKWEDARSLKAELLKLLRRIYVSQSPPAVLRKALWTFQTRSVPGVEPAPRQQSVRARQPELAAAL